MIPYLSYVALITTVSFLFYRLLLRRETYFRLNRWFFLCCLLCAFILPLLPIPGALSLRSRFQTQAPSRAQVSQPQQSLPTQSLPSRALSTLSVPSRSLPSRSLPTVQSSQTSFSSTRPISWTSVKAEQTGYKAPNVANPSPAQTISVAAQTKDEFSANETDADPTFVPTRVITRANAITPSRTITRANAITPTHAPASAAAASMVKPKASGRPTFSYALLMQWLWYVYVAGLWVFGLHLLLQLLVLGYQIHTHPVRREGRYRIVEMSGNRAPCSFGPYIFLNPALYDEETYHQILSHEKIHVAQSHSLDILLAEIGKVIQWFNPFAWMYRKALEANLEFLTDASRVRNPTINVVQYQLSLLKVSVPNLPLSVTSNYNQSLLKKRIAMMHNKPSSLKNSWKYLILLPVLVGMTSIFNDSFAGSSTKGLSTALISDPFLYGNHPDTLPGRIAQTETPLAGPAPAADTTPAPVAPSGPEPNTPTGNVRSVQVETASPLSDSISIKTADRVVVGYPSPKGIDRVVQGYPTANLSLNVSPVVITDVQVQPEMMVGREPLPVFGWPPFMEIP
jgi:beta-lactamase regulating signal transducer with metallopeptidase domain